MLAWLRSMFRSANAGDAIGPAILTVCLGMFCLGVSDALAKWLTAYYSPLQIIFMRNLIAAPIVCLAAWKMVGRGVFRSRHLRMYFLRGFLLVAAAYCFFLSMRYISLAEATSLVFAAPIFITALSVPLLREAVGWRRWSAVLVGFVGVLIIVQPGGEAFQPASLLPLCTAALYALLMITARKINRTESIWTMMVYVVLFPLLISGLMVGLVWNPLQEAHLLHFVGVAIFGTLGMTFVSQAFRLAPAAVVAPFDYTAILWAMLFGWLIWGELPAWTVYLGVFVIILSTGYISWRELRRTSRLPR